MESSFRRHLNPMQACRAVLKLVEMGEELFCSARMKCCIFAVEYTFSWPENLFQGQFIIWTGAEGFTAMTV